MVVTIIRDDLVTPGSDLVTQRTLAGPDLHLVSLHPGVLTFRGHVDMFAVDGGT